jgi:hypothetical protein
MPARLTNVLFLAAWCFGVFAWFRSLAFQVKAARRTRPGKHWWLRMNTLDPIIDPAAWSPEARAYWRRHLLWAGIFLACVASGFVIAHLGGFPTEQKQ